MKFELVILDTSKIGWKIVRRKMGQGLESFSSSLKQDSQATNDLFPCVRGIPWFAIFPFLCEARGMPGQTLKREVTDWPPLMRRMASAISGAMVRVRIFGP